MKCAQIYIDIYNANTSKFKYIFILEFFVAVRLVTFLRYIPSQTLVVVNTLDGSMKRQNSPSRSEDRLFTSIPVHITMDPCKIVISRHSS